MSEKNPNPDIPHENLSDEVNSNIVESEIEGGVELKNLRLGDELIIKTENTIYKFKYLGKNKALLSGNAKYCPEPIEVEIRGSTWGANMLKSGYIGRGMHLEYRHTVLQKIIVTSEIKEIKDEKNKLVLAIESSTDETASAVILIADGKTKTLSSVVKSQIKLHSKMGGVVPEAAARAHVKYIRPVVEQALKDKGLKIKDIDFIAVTHGPGLLPSLLVGVEFAKALSFASGKPMIPVNHMLGHLYSPLKDKGSKIKDLFPMISLIVSGGHTILVLMKDIKNYKVLGQTVDDAAGEAFDKVAKMLGLPYPGGPVVSRLAEKGNPNSINFPRPMLNQKNYNFSFSGLKTAVLYYLKDKGSKIKNKRLLADVCASFQEAAVDVLVQKTMRAVKEFGAKSVSLSGGVAANMALRNALNLKSKILNLKFFVPPINLCTDNAEMIGLAAAHMLKNGFKPVPYKKVKADSNLEL